MDEFAMGSATENSAFQKTRNPWNIAKVPGGSSGGSAASVVAGECFASLGSDTGGSIRQPAAFCGCVGLKPTYGLVSRYGLFAFASSLDQIGPLARSVEDCARMLQVIAGYDPRDNTSANRPVDNYLPETEIGETPLAGKKIGVPESILAEGLSEDVKDGCAKAIAALKNLGADIIGISLPSPEIASAVYYIVAMAEASSNLARYDGVRYGRRAAGADTLDELYTKSRSEGFGQEVKRRVMLGSYILSSGFYDAYYRKAAQTRKIITKEYIDALTQCDAIGMPVAPVTAWDIGAHLDNPLQAYLMDAFTLPVNLAGLPALSLPTGLGQKSGMPVGFQLIGDYFAEKQLLNIAAALEMALPKAEFPDLPN
ncbi:MAG: aspartyl/glutamyl-tRNA amidotransferase subunit A, partial [Desulfovibrio sp.]|nr:aspartyl/glutamyl-tRNA amidotransferase subunit A [Desulfovibrio sp.]